AGLANADRAVGVGAGGGGADGGDDGDPVDVLGTGAYCLAGDDRRAGGAVPGRIGDDGPRGGVGHRGRLDGDPRAVPQRVGEVIGGRRSAVVADAYVVGDRPGAVAVRRRRPDEVLVDRDVRERRAGVVVGGLTIRGERGAVEEAG